MFEMVVSFCFLLGGELTCDVKRSGHAGMLYRSQSECRFQAAISETKWKKKAQTVEAEIAFSSFDCLKLEMEA